MEGISLGFLVAWGRENLARILRSACISGESLHSFSTRFHRTGLAWNLGECHSFRPKEIGTPRFGLGLLHLERENLVGDSEENLPVLSEFIQHRSHHGIPV
jgi:hypothetical protein